jgi:short-subunit dehydrogenase
MDGNEYLSEYFQKQKMNIVVNGATRGIGREVVLHLAKDRSNKILATGRSRDQLEALSRNHDNIRTIAIDLSEFDKYSNDLMKIIVQEINKIDILINTAGLMIPREFMEIKNNEARQMMETNFFGPASVIRILRPFLHEGSHIVNISSMGGFQGSSKYRGLAYYSASKAAIACLTECLAVEFADSGIIVNCLALGAVQTEMLNEAFPGYKAPVSANEMGEFIADFAMKGHKFFNGKILPVAVSNP